MAADRGEAPPLKRRSAGLGGTGAVEENNKPARYSRSVRFRQSSRPGPAALRAARALLAPQVSR